MNSSCDTADNNRRLVTLSWSISSFWGKRNYSTIEVMITNGNLEVKGILKGSAFGKISKLIALSNPLLDIVSALSLRVGNAGQE